jgi:hypothetical protein
MPGSPDRRDHSLQHLTDVRTRRVAAACGEGYVAIGWDYPGSTLLRVRILRSEAGFAESPEAGVGLDVVYDDVSGSFRDTAVSAGRAYCYSVFARPEDGEWVRWTDLRLAPDAPTGHEGPDGGGVT